MESYTTTPAHLIAPSGLDCFRCVGCSEGYVAEHAIIIAKALGSNFQSYASRLTTFNPSMKNYPAFRDLLNGLSSPKCDGCRSDKRNCLPTCMISDCVKKRGLNFCFQCKDFPECMETGLSGDLLERWQSNNELIKNIGISEYILKMADMPRYP